MDTDTAVCSELLCLQLKLKPKANVTSLRCIGLHDEEDLELDDRPQP